MKKILLFIVLSYSTALLANDALNDFIDAQIKIEAQLLDQNLSLEKKIKIKDKQVTQYKEFFFRYASNKEENLQKTNPDRSQVNRLKLRLRSNKQKGYTSAAQRDELLLHIFSLRRGIRTAINEILRETNGKSKKYFEEQVNAIISKHYSKYKPLDKRKNTIHKKTVNTKIAEQTLFALKTYEALENVTYTLSAEAIDNAKLIYNTGHFSDSKIFALVNQINKSEMGIKANSYLQYVHIDVAKVLLLVLLILIILVMQFIINFIITLILRHYKIKEDDRAYIQSRITKVFNYIASLMVIHLLLVSYIGFDTASLNLSKAFSILYVILMTILLYRITNTIAYMKMESMKQSKVLKNEVVNLSIKVINSLIIIVAIIVILHIFGVNLTALLSGLGIAGAAIAFAAKDSISNIFASVSILMGDVFAQGEWIETSTISGTVVEIGLRGTTIRTFDNALISIPNSELANQGVKNWSRRSVGRRIKMDLGVTYQSEFSDIKKAISDIREMLKAHPGIANESTSYKNAYRHAKLVSAEDYKGVKRTTLVYMDSYGASSINILVYCFSRTVDWAEWLEVKEDVMYKIAEILEENQLAFAYPTMTLHQAEEKEEEPKG